MGANFYLFCTCLGASRALSLLLWKASWGAYVLRETLSSRVKNWPGPLGTASIKITGTWLRARRSVFCSLLWWPQSVMWVLGVLFILDFRLNNSVKRECINIIFLFHWLCIYMLDEPPIFKTSCLVCHLIKED